MYYNKYELMGKVSQAIGCDPEDIIINRTGKASCYFTLGSKEYGSKYGRYSVNKGLTLHNSPCVSYTLTKEEVKDIDILITDTPSSCASISGMINNLSRNNISVLV